jgi:hypothetical protein
MSLDGAITNLASWAGNVMMPTMAGGFFAAAVYRYSKGGQFEQLLYGGFASLMCSGMLRALEGFVQHAGPTSADGFWPCIWAAWSRRSIRARPGSGSSSPQWER